MSAGFTSGTSAYREVELMDVLPPELRGFSSQAQQEAFAAKYEQATGVLVRYPWENETQREARRNGFKATVVPELGGDPVRLQRSLDRTLIEIQNLTRDNPKYDEIMKSLVERANKFERKLGLKETVVAGVNSVPVKEPEPEPPPEALAKFEAFSALSKRKKVESAQATKDVEFLKLIRDRESEPEAVEAATLRLVDLERTVTA